MPLYTRDLFLAKALSYTISVEKASSAYDRQAVQRKRRWFYGTDESF